MSVNKNIGFFRGIVDNVRLLSYKNNVAIQPVSPIADQSIPYNTLKNIATAKDSYGSNATFHWGSHKWGDTQNCVSR